MQSSHIEYIFGPVPRQDGIIRFQVWAPGVEQMKLELNGAVARPMRRVAEGFHELDCRCAPGTRYRYQLPSGMSVPDPASRLQDGDVHDASIVLDHDSYQWRHPDWRGRPWTEAVIYELHVGLLGGFRGVQSRLQELADLGITAIELMPIADFPGPRNWGYDGVLPYAPDGAYGSPDALKQLVDAAHGLGIMVILDVVYNHFGPDGNYLSRYAPDFFRGDLETPWGPAIDFRKMPVRSFFAENALYWLREYRFDGLRLDAVHAISDQTWLPEMAQFVRERLDADRYVHLILENDQNTASLLQKGYDAQWNDDAHHVLHTVLTGEDQGYYGAYAEDTTGKLARVLAEGFVFQGEPSPWHKGKRRGEPSTSLPPTAFVFFLQNHDQTGNRALGERLVSLCKSSDALHAAVALQLLTPHIPMLFMGEEYGTESPFLYFTSFTSDELACAVREGRRKEFAGFPEFSDPRARERIPDPNAEDTWRQCKLDNAAGKPQAVQWRKRYRRLLRLRGAHITPYLNGAHSASASVLAPLCVVARWQLGNEAILSLYCNLSRSSVELPDEIPAGETLFFHSRAESDTALLDGRIAAESLSATLTALREPPAEVWS
ncbi:MAG TPA: malto-oligosyltrehalose trehalohydrolase [Candidimonas sp.]|nr:malto-oligosyltrehalose trehalohydrolase [Candidimonas sp.]